MRKLICLFVLLISQLHAAGEFRLAAESEPLLTVANCVNVADGSFFQVDQDLVVDGPIPLSFARHYDSGKSGLKFNHYGYGVGLGYPLFIKETPHEVYVEQRHRYGLPFKYLKMDRQPTAKGKLDPVVYLSGYTNCTEALERGHPCMAHAELVLTKSSDEKNRIFDVTDADGTKRTYTYYTSKSVGKNYYLLRQAEHPNGLTTYYRYEDGVRLTHVELKNTSDGELLTSLAFQYDTDNNYYTVIGSDGRKAYHALSNAYRYYTHTTDSAVVTPFLMAVSSDSIPQKNYYYATNNGGTKTFPLLCRIDDLRGGYLYADYICGGGNRYADYSYVKPFSKVKTLSGPIGKNNENHVLYSFNYQPNSTTVRNALGVENTYSCGQGCLSELTEGTSRIRKYSWSHGQLLKKSLLNNKRKLLEAVYYQYDKKGNIAQKWNCGNITGSSPDEYSCRDTFKAGNDNVRIHSYEYGPYCNIIEEKAPNGTITTYGYKAGTNLLTSKLVSSDGIIQEREFYDYDKNGILIQKVEDDGAGQDRNDLSNVTYWLVTRIQPQMDRDRWGLTKPAVEEKYYFDFIIGQEKLFGRTEFEYARGGQIAEKRVYDATGALAYQESFRYNQLGNHPHHSLLLL